MPYYNLTELEHAHSCPSTTVPFLEMQFVSLLTVEKLN